MQDTLSSARGWLWFIRALALASIFLLIWVGALYPCGEHAWLASAIGTVPYTVAYLWVLWRTQRRLGWTLGLSVVCFCIAVLCFFRPVSPFPLIWPDRPNELLRVVWACNAAVQAVLVFSVLRTKRALEADAAQLVFGSLRLLGYFLLWGVILAVTLPEVMRSPIAADEASAVGAVRTLHECAEIARSRGLSGFSYNLRTLQEEGCLPKSLAEGQSSGYRFSVGPRTDRAGKFIGYSISARPLEYGSNCSGVRSFYANEDGFIRFTAEDRPATEEDPVLQ